MLVLCGKRNNRSKFVCSERIINTEIQKTSPFVYKWINNNGHCQTTQINRKFASIYSTNVVHNSVVYSI